jgi:catechol 2,3-dioxygenase-like lactoylglutathione lyase family enzyme
LAYEFEHIHLKAPDPEKTANWYVKAFNFEIFNDRGVRPTGDRFIECKSEDGTIFRISGARTDENMGTGDADVHYGLEHFGITVDDMDAEIERLQALGAELAEGPISNPGGPTIAFIKVPDDVRIELLQLPK